MMRKKITNSAAILIAVFLNIGIKSQTGAVGINTSTPNKATVLDITSNKKGILIPRLSDTERDTNLADNDIATKPPLGVVNQSLTSGTLIFNTTTNAFQYWDGELWRQLFVTKNSTRGNDGVVKINSGGSAEIKPVYNLTASGSGYGTDQQILYSTPLNFAPSPTTNWPENTVPYPGTTSSIYYTGTTDAAQRWKENPVEGQVHVWRLIASVDPGANSSGSVRSTLLNPDSGFKVTSVQEVPKGSGSGNIVTMYFYTIADANSIAPGKGYQIFIQADFTCKLTIESLTRISLFKD